MTHPANLSRELAAPSSRTEARSACGNDTNLLTVMSDFDNKNVVAPAYNSCAAEPINAGLNIANGVSRGGEFIANKFGADFQAPQLHIQEMDAGKPKDGSAEFFVQQASSTAGSLLVYAMAGKLAGKSMRSAAGLLPLETGSKSVQRVSAFAHAAAHDTRVATVLGATAYATIKDTKEGESHLSNGLGTFVGFTAFEGGNSFINPRANKLGQFGQRFMVGYAGGVAQANASSLVQNHCLDKTGSQASGLSGGFMNALLPSCHKTIDAASSWSHPSSRAVPTSLESNARCAKAAGPEFFSQPARTSNPVMPVEETVAKIKTFEVRQAQKVPKFEGSLDGSPVGENNGTSDSARASLTPRAADQIHSARCPLLDPDVIKGAIDKLSAVDWKRKGELHEQNAELNQRIMTAETDFQNASGNKIAPYALLSNAQIERLLVNASPELKICLIRLGELKNEQRIVHDEARKIWTTEQTALSKIFCPLKMFPPEVTLRPASEADHRYSAAYSSGTGKVEIFDLNGVDKASPEFLQNMMHEFTHYEQDWLQVRRLADRLKIGQDYSGNDLLNLRKLYEKERGVELDSRLANKVLDARQGMALSETEGQRADDLFKSFRQSLGDIDRRERIEQFERFLMLPQELKHYGIYSLLGEDATVWDKHIVESFGYMPDGLDTYLRTFKTELHDKVISGCEAPFTPSQAKVIDQVTSCFEREVDAHSKDGVLNPDVKYQLYRQYMHERESWDVDDRTFQTALSKGAQK